MSEHTGERERLAAWLEVVADRDCTRDFPGDEYDEAHLRRAAALLRSGGEGETLAVPVRELRLVEYVAGRKLEETAADWEEPDADPEGAEGAADLRSFLLRIRRRLYPGSYPVDAAPPGPGRPR